MATPRRTVRHTGIGNRSRASTASRNSTQSSTDGSGGGKKTSRLLKSMLRRGGDGSTTKTSKPGKLKTRSSSDSTSHRNIAVRAKGILAPLSSTRSTGGNMQLSEYRPATGSSSGAAEAACAESRRTAI
eukprot:CAMPEP_0178470800 /NCGR_PEP_ID=MMETSP0696-20121128/709_1 /TAXON_ID=265572 /ORGANISM="Extubocellulus spinifer, Strain CCMP396" /LENGTH=128 /DNA_ID=CAMNT_0020097905 /DNA_START=310 /DNA_END=696 /DNA_ORIENTATION=-